MSTSAATSRPQRSLRFLRGVLLFVGILTGCVACTGRSHASYDELVDVLDSLSLPAEFRMTSEQRYQFNDGPQGDKANAVKRTFDPGKLEDVYAAVRSSLAAGGVRLLPNRKSPDSGEEFSDFRVQARVRGASVVVFTDTRPVEVRAYD